MAQLNFVLRLTRKYLTTFLWEIMQLLISIGGLMSGQSVKIIFTHFFLLIFILQSSNQSFSWSNYLLKSRKPELNHFFDFIMPLSSTNIARMVLVSCER